MKKEKFPDIDWWCDNCRAYLNDQPGFMDSKGSWKCAECGYTSSITEADIVYDSPAEEYSDADFQTCTNCGRSIADANLTLPWEAGNNPSAYVRCPHCGYDNILSGFGEDDD
ncbi:hypothetical protein ACFQ5J_06090 [Lacticaseibacillus baoqingensis]|uniref:Uncharacterized protein n=1 Tax=Lacticaseibacillus baoqingensis TaxID=2486013 RepID=A0ABW4E7U6_9LACO|nr:hypothetical protein [Lacticaseibacillus baoqingensis]